MFPVTTLEVTSGAALSRAGMLMLLCMASCVSFAQQTVTLVNPYERVDWATAGQYKANLHTHSTEGGGTNTPAEVIDFYHDRGYSILAFTDNDECTYPWEDWGRVPEALGMLALRGNEHKNHEHIAGYFVCMKTDSSSETQTLSEIGAGGGAAVLVHPGRYWELEGGKVPEEVLQRYVTRYTEFPQERLIGFEVFNAYNIHPRDRQLWDALLGAMMPQRPVWGFANDDTHWFVYFGLPMAGLSWNVILAERLDEASVRAAMETGRFYFSSVGTQVDPSLWNAALVPVITDITHDRTAGTVTVSALSGGQPLPEGRYRWISGGETVHIGSSLDYQNTPGIVRYVRLELESDGGSTLTNPFGIVVQEENEGEPSPQYHPGDLDGNGRFIMGEALAYLAGWQQGVYPMSYAIRGVYLWQNGEMYGYDPGRMPPLCWDLAAE
ncbi:MAG: hypothetical protein KA031_03920 [Candidatus Hydrogenedentes bacterium]|nr:hypothetical protein [Candidatus Hydrogenedentota bacterium]